MNDRKLLIGALAALALLLAASWAWFYASQQRTDSQLAMLMSKAGSSGGANGGHAAADPYKDEAVKNTLRKHTEEFRKLWLAYLDKKPARTEGEIEADWQIGADGEVLEAGIVHSDFDNAALNDGVLKVLKNIHYPQPPMGQRTYVAHKFKLKKEKE
jgi:outer membrane biosynthesis protein TonB